MERGSRGRFQRKAAKDRGTGKVRLHELGKALEGRWDRAQIGNDA